MAVDERARHRLFHRLEDVLGAEEAAVLMQHLPPVGWADVATKHDLGQLEERMGLRMEAMESRLRGEMHQLAAKGYRTMLLGMTATTFTVGGLAFAAARLV